LISPICLFRTYHSLGRRRHRFGVRRRQDAWQKFQKSFLHAHAGPKAHSQGWPHHGKFPHCCLELLEVFYLTIFICVFLIQFSHFYTFSNGLSQGSGIGEPSLYHALVVIFLEFFAWGLLTTPMITVTINLHICSLSLAIGQHYILDISGFK
jgi:hypothetical protein